MRKNRLMVYQPSTPQIHFKGMTVMDTYKFCFGFFSIHDVSTTLVFWEAIISPHVDNCSSILFLATKKQLRRLQLNQNQAMRILLSSGWRTPRVGMLDKLGWQSVKQRIRYNTLMLVHKIKIWLVPNYLTNKVTFRQNTRYPLRNAGDFGLPKVKKRQRRTVFFIMALNYIMNYQTT
jgi:hypothetical protein